MIGRRTHDVECFVGIDCLSCCALLGIWVTWLPFLSFTRVTFVSSQTHALWRHSISQNFPGLVGHIGGTKLCKVEQQNVEFPGRVGFTVRFNNWTVIVGFVSSKSHYCNAHKVRRTSARIPCRLWRHECVGVLWDGLHLAGAIVHLQRFPACRRAKLVQVWYHNLHWYYHFSHIWTRCKYTKHNSV